MTNTIKLKVSSTTGITPANLSIGELAYNSADNKLFAKNSSGTIVQVNSGGTPAGSNTQIQFNNNGVFGATSNLSYASNALNIGTNVSIGNDTLSLANAAGYALTISGVGGGAAIITQTGTAGASTGCVFTQNASSSIYQVFTTSTDGTVVKTRGSMRLTQEDSGTFNDIGISITSAGVSLYAEGTRVVPFNFPQNSSTGTVGPGTSGNVLTSGGSSANPYWAAPSLARTITVNDSTAGLAITQSNTFPAALTVSGNTSSGSAVTMTNINTGANASTLLITHQGASNAVNVSIPNNVTGFGISVSHAGDGAAFNATGAGAGYAFSAVNRSGADSSNSKSINVGRVDLISVTLLSNPRLGSLEFNGTDLFFTKSGATRVNLSSPIDNVGLQGITTFTSGTTTFTIPSGITKIKVTAIGSGASGAAGNSTGINWGGGGGGGGGTVIAFLTNLTPGNTLTVRVGDPNGATALLKSSVVSSGTQTIGSLTAGGGVTGDTGDSPFFGFGGLGGSATGGLINIVGEVGESGFGTELSRGGRGGSTYLSAGGRGSYVLSNGATMTALAGTFGSGGGGGSVFGATTIQAGGGSNGIVIFEY